MSKNKIRGYIVLAVLAALLSIIAFAAPFKRETVFWLGYGFGIFSILFQIIVFNIAFSAAGDPKSNFYGFPIATIGTTYLILQLIVTVIEMAVSTGMAAWIALILNAVLLAFVIISCIGADVQRDEAARQDEKITRDTTLMKSLIADAAALADLSEDSKMKKILQNVGEKFRFSDPLSSPETESIETELKNQTDEIRTLLLAGKADETEGLCKKLLITLAERNRICSLNKKH